MVINRIYEHQNLLSLQLVSFLVGLRTYRHPVKNHRNALVSQIYFWNGTLRVSDRFSVRHQESSTVYTATGVCHKVMLIASILILLASSQHNLYDIYLLLCVQC